LAIPPKTFLNCREGDISILRQALAADLGQRFLERIAPILSRSCPASLFVLDDLIDSSRSLPAILGRMGWNDFDGMRTFRFPCIRDFSAAYTASALPSYAGSKRKPYLTVE
jgi:hypothetical protein